MGFRGSVRVRPAPAIERGRPCPISRPSLAGAGAATRLPPVREMATRSIFRRADGSRLHQYGASTGARTPGGRPPAPSGRRGLLPDGDWARRASFAASLSHAQIGAIRPPPGAARPGVWDGSPQDMRGGIAGPPRTGLAFLGRPDQNRKRIMKRHDIAAPGPVGGMYENGFSIGS